MQCSRETTQTLYLQASKSSESNGYFNEVMYCQTIDSEFKWIKKKQLCSDFILWYEQIINAELSNITLPL